AARTLAQKTLREGGDSTDAKIDFIARRLLARPLTGAEGVIVRESLNDLMADYKAKPDEAKKLIAVGDSKAEPTMDPTSLAAWTMLVNHLMNLDEVLKK